MKSCRWFVALLLSVVTSGVFAQRPEMAPPVPVSEPDFALTSPIVTPGSGAVVLFDIGQTSLAYEDEGWTLTYSRTKRIRILEKNGMDAATVRLTYSGYDNKKRKLKSLKASTYNLTAGKMEKTDLDPKQIFLEKEKNSDLLVEKFTMPEVRVGSVIEYSYTMKSTELFDFWPWQFQGKYPVIKSEYTAVIPELFNYAILPHGDLSNVSKTVKKENKDIWVGNGHSSVDLFSITWTLKNGEVIPDESYVFREDAAVAGIAFQLSAVPDRDGHQRAYLRSWPKLVGDMLGSDTYREEYGKNKRLLHDWIETVSVGKRTTRQKAEKIFYFVRDSIFVTGYSGVAESQPAETFRRRTGTRADVNLLLARLLSIAGIPASPVMLATRDKDPLSPDYPVAQNVNYTIVKARIENADLFLDASHRSLLFNELLPACFNGYAIAVEPGAPAIYLNPDSLLETSTTRITAGISDSGLIQTRTVFTPGQDEAYLFREVMHFPDSAKEYFSRLGKKLEVDETIKAKVTVPVNDPDSELTIDYHLDLNPSGEKTIYFNAMLNHNLKGNPFPAGKRFNPIDLEHPTETNFLIEINIPAGWEIQSYPKSARMTFNGNEGIFDYLVTGTPASCRINCRLRLNKTRFPVDDYDNLRGFYAAVIEKESQLIVLRRK